MPEKSLTLYKLMILFMLDNLEFPLSHSQLSEFLVGRGYVSYFEFQQAISELAESGFLRGEMMRNTTQYYLNASGREAVSMFTSKIPKEIRQDILDYFAEQKYELRKEVEITADYYPTQKGDYMVKTEIKEKGSTLLALHLNVTDREQAVAVCDRWAEKSDAVYTQIVETLLL